MYLAELRYKRQAGLPTGNWGEYIDVLPARTGTVLEWPAKEVCGVLGY